MLDANGAKVELDSDVEAKGLDFGNVHDIKSIHSDDNPGRIHGQSGSSIMNL